MPIAYDTAKITFWRDNTIRISLQYDNNHDTKSAQDLLNEVGHKLSKDTGIGWFNTLHTDNSVYQFYGNNVAWTPFMFSLVEYFFGNNVLPYHLHELKNSYVDLTRYDLLQIVLNIFNISTNFVYNMRLADPILFDISRKPQVSRVGHNTNTHQNWLYGMREITSWDILNLSLSCGIYPSLSDMFRIDIREVMTSSYAWSLSTNNSLEPQGFHIYRNMGENTTKRHSLGLVNFNLVNPYKTNQVKVLNDYCMNNETAMVIAYGSLFVEKEHYAQVNTLIDSIWQEMVPRDIFPFSMKNVGINIFGADQISALLGDAGIKVAIVTYQHGKKVLRNNWVDLSSFDLVISINKCENNIIHFYTKDETVLTLAKLYT